MDIICVVLGADTKNFRTKDSIKLIEYTFKTFEYFNIKDFISESITKWQNNHPNFFLIEKGQSNFIEITIDDWIEKTPIIPIKKDLIPGIEATISLQSYHQAPLNQADKIGQLEISSQGTNIKTLNLFSNTTIKKNNLLDYMFCFFKSYPNQLQQCLF